MFAIPSTSTCAFDVRVLAASAATSGLDMNGNSIDIPFQSPDSIIGSIYFCLIAPKETPPISHAAYVAAVLGLDLVFKLEGEKAKR